MKNLNNILSKFHEVKKELQDLVTMNNDKVVSKNNEITNLTADVKDLSSETRQAKKVHKNISTFIEGK